MNPPNPPKRITDPTFDYVKSDFTDLRVTFARIRSQLESWEPVRPEAETEKEQS